MTKILFVDGSNLHEGIRFSMKRYQNEMVKALSLECFKTEIFKLKLYHSTILTLIINNIRLFFLSRQFDYVVLVDHSEALYSLFCNRRKRIIVVHDLIMLETKSMIRKYYRSLIYRVIATSTTLCFASEITRRLFIKRFDWYGNSLVLSPCVDIANRDGRSHKIKSEIIHVLFVGNNNEYKNRKHILELIRYAARNSFPFEFLLITPELGELDAAEFSNYSNVTFLSNISDDKIRQAYNAADILVVPSLNEGFGWHCIEAIASGCVVLSTANGGLLESVKSDIYISGDDCLETATAIVHLVANRTKYLEQQLDNIQQYDSVVFREKIRELFRDKNR